MARFTGSDAVYAGLVGFLTGSDAAGLTYDELESRLESDGRALPRQLFQDHRDLRAAAEQRHDNLVDADDRAHGAVEPDHRRVLATIFGEVIVTRLAYRAKQAANLHPADAALNLPIERHSPRAAPAGGHRGHPGSCQQAATAITRQTRGAGRQTPGRGLRRWPAPKAARTWLTASVVDDAASVIADVFDRAQRRDPHDEHAWAALVDGNNHQFDRTTAA